MPISVACQCGQAFQAKDALAGKTVKCPKCGDPITIPSPPQDDPLGGDRANLEGASSPTGLGGSDLTALEQSAVGYTSTFDAVNQGGLCPICHAAIVEGAVICTSCGTRFGSDSERETVEEKPKVKKRNTGTEGSFLALGVALGVAVVVGVAVTGVLMLGTYVGIGILVTVATAIFWAVVYIWQNRCDECKKWWAMQKTGKTKGGLFGTRLFEYEYKCTNCGHREWRDARTEGGDGAGE